MKRKLLLAFLSCVLASLTGTVWAQQNDYSAKLKSLSWVMAPGYGNIANVDQVRIVNGYRFLNSSETSKFLVINGNPPRDNGYTLFSENLGWFSIFGYDPSGYVKDDEKIDPDELLNILKEQNRSGIEERKRLNLSILKLEGWYVAPHYDPLTHRLEWG